MGLLINPATYFIILKRESNVTLQGYFFRYILKGLILKDYLEKSGVTRDA
jgi:hypothetical protein